MYLANINNEVQQYGFAKVLQVRKEIIHLKHIFTEIFVRKTIDIEYYLNQLNMSLFSYMEFMTNKMRSIHHLSREFKVNDINDIVTYSHIKFFPVLKLLKQFNNLIVLDFDGVTTDPKFKHLYDLCVSRCSTVICSANPSITEDWFIKNNYQLPKKIYSCKGKIKKLNVLIHLNLKYDNIFYIDNEEMYLEFAWVFGIKTFHWTKNEILYYTRNTK